MINQVICPNNFTSYKYLPSYYLFILRKYLYVYKYNVSQYMLVIIY